MHLSVTQLVFLLLLFLTRSTYSQTLDTLLSDIDPINTIPAQALKELLQEITPLEKDANAEQQTIIDLLQLRHLAIIGDLDAALELVEKIDNPSTRPEYRIRAYTTAIVIHHVQGNYTKAFQLLNKAQQLLPWTSNKTIKYLALSSATELYIDAADLEKALDYAKQALAAAHQTNNPVNICTAYDGLSGSYYKLNKLDQARQSNLEMIEQCDAIPMPLFSGSGHLGLGMALQKQGKHQNALEQFETAKKLYQQAEYTIGIGYALLFSAKSHLALGKIALAQQHLDEVIPLLESLGQWNSLKDAYAYQSELSAKAGNHEAALEWFQKRFLAEKRVLDKTQALQIAKLQVEYEIKNKEQHIDLLLKENELLALQKRSSLLLAWLVILGLTLVALVSALLWRRARRESSHFKHLSRIDPLTGLFNHAYCYSLAEQKFHQCRQDKQPFAVVVADIDWFKRVNDTYGHAAGDKVLQAIAKVLNKHMGSHGIAGRTGGEEFTCFLPGMDIEEALKAVANCRDDIQPVMDYGKEIEVTLSYGLAVSHGEYNVLDILVREADEALYEAKNLGRNQIVTHNDLTLRKKA
ncbi:diguanylate cyclase [Thiolapillus sp.]